MKTPNRFLCLLRSHHEKHLQAIWCWISQNTKNGNWCICSWHKKNSFNYNYSICWAHTKTTITIMCSELQLELTTTTILPLTQRKPPQLHLFYVTLQQPSHFFLFYQHTHTPWNPFTNAMSLDLTPRKPTQFVCFWSSQNETKNNYNYCVFDPPTKKKPIQLCFWSWYQQNQHN